MCPVGGKCLKDNVIYQAIVTEKISKKVETYIGLASTSFKARLANHKASMKNRNLEKNCKLAQHIWDLRDKKIEIEEIEWKIIDRGQPYSNITDRCNLCIKEKFYILYKPEMSTINMRSEITAGCRHKTSLLLDKGKPD